MADAVQRLEHDLRAIFGARFESLVTYGERTRAAQRGEDPPGAGARPHAQDDLALQTLAIVATLTADDLRVVAGRVNAWHAAGLATPLLLAGHEFERSLDAFPLEFGAILADHTVVAGVNPFERMTVKAADLRRAVEVQARGHLLHLREGYLETAGKGDGVAALLARSAPALAALLTSVARLEGRDTHDPRAAARHAEHLLGISDGILTEIVALTGVEVQAAKADRLLTPYLDAVQRLVQYVDNWSAR